jgi:hypothetical protein
MSLDWQKVETRLARHDEVSVVRLYAIDMVKDRYLKEVNKTLHANYKMNAGDPGVVYDISAVIVGKEMMLVVTTEVYVPQDRATSNNNGVIEGQWNGCNRSGICGAHGKTSGTLSVPMYIAREELDTDFIWTRGIVDEPWSRRQSLRVL